MPPIRTTFFSDALQRQFSSMVVVRAITSPVLQYIAVHHTGGLGTDQYASTKHLTFAEINAAHRQRWNFESKYIAGAYAGYNFVINTDTGEYRQFRALGEETAAQSGFNFNTVSICLIGNYNINPYSKITVDQMGEKGKETLVSIIRDLVAGDVAKYVTVPGAVYQMSYGRVYPHRHFGATECYGTGLPDNWARGLIVGFLTKQISLLQKILQLYYAILDRGNLKAIARMASVASNTSDRSCDGCIHPVL